MSGGGGGKDTEARAPQFPTAVDEVRAERFRASEYMLRQLRALEAKCVAQDCMDRSLFLE